MMPTNTTDELDQMRATRRLAFFALPEEFVSWLEEHRERGNITLLEKVDKALVPISDENWFQYFSSHDQLFLSRPGAALTLESSGAVGIGDLGAVHVVPPYIRGGTLYMTMIGTVVYSRESTGLALFDALKRSWTSALHRPVWATPVDGGPVQRVKAMAYTKGAADFAASGLLMVRDQPGNRYLTHDPGWVPTNDRVS